MNYLLETLIIVGIAIFCLGFISLICFRGRDEHYFIVTDVVRKDHYVLKKSKFLFLFAYGLTWNWKTGLIRKSVLWGYVACYLYYLLFYIADLVYYLVTSKNMIFNEPVLFVVFSVVVPFVAGIVASFLTAISTNRENTDAFAKKP